MYFVSKVFVDEFFLLLIKKKFIRNCISKKYVYTSAFIINYFHYEVTLNDLFCVFCYNKKHISFNNHYLSKQLISEILQIPPKEKKIIK